MVDLQQPSLFSDTPEVEAVAGTIRDVLSGWAQPSAWELLEAVDHELGLKARWVIADAVSRIIFKLDTAVLGFGTI